MTGTSVCPAAVWVCPRVCTPPSSNIDPEARVRSDPRILHIPASRSASLRVSVRLSWCAPLVSVIVPRFRFPRFHTPDRPCRLDTAIAHNVRLHHPRTRHNAGFRYTIYNPRMSYTYPAYAVIPCLIITRCAAGDRSFQLERAITLPCGVALPCLLRQPHNSTTAVRNAVPDESHLMRSFITSPLRSCAVCG